MGVLGHLVNPASTFVFCIKNGVSMLHLSLCSYKLAIVLQLSMVSPLKLSTNQGRTQTF